MQARALTEAWMASGFFQGLGEHLIRLHAHEMWRIAAKAAGAKHVEASILFGRQPNGDGLRRAFGPGSFEAAYQAALREKQAREAPQE